MRTSEDQVDRHGRHGGGGRDAAPYCAAQLAGAAVAAVPYVRTAPGPEVPAPPADPAPQVEPGPGRHAPTT